MLDHGSFNTAAQDPAGEPKRRTPAAGALIRQLRRASASSLCVLASLVGLGQIGAHATVVPMPGAPILSVLAPPANANGYIFNLEGFAAGTQLGEIIPPFGAAPSGPAPAIGGPCLSFVTGQICRTLEPGIGAGFRDWEVEIANETGPAVEAFNAGFRAPGINRVFRVVLPKGTGDFFDFRYPGPTLPLFGVFSTLGVPVTLASSIVDPPISDIPLPFETFFDPAVSDCATNPAGCASFTENDSLTPDFTTTAGVPEPATLALLAVGLLGLGAMHRRKTAQPH